MPAANHSYYLRNCYLDNNITKSKLTIDNVRIDLKEITIPIYNLATREDHIAPAKSVYLGSTFFGGPMRYVLSGAGHISRRVNPPPKKKDMHWTGGTPPPRDVQGGLPHGAVIRTEVNPEQALEHGSQVGGGLEIALVVEIGLLEARPIGNDPAALERAADQERHRGGAVIGPIGAVDARGPPEFGDQRHHGLLPGWPHILFDRPEGAINRTKQVCQAPSHCALVSMGIPAVQRQRTDPRSVRTGENLAGGARDLGEIGLDEIDIAELHHRPHVLRTHDGWSRRCAPPPDPPNLPEPRPFRARMPGEGDG